MAVIGTPAANEYDRESPGMAWTTASHTPGTRSFAVTAKEPDAPPEPPTST